VAAKKNPRVSKKLKSTLTTPTPRQYATRDRYISQAQRKAKKMAEKNPDKGIYFMPNKKPSQKTAKA
jgi:hypothetical protein